MKILTGRLRGQTIHFQANPHLRPTSDKVRKAIFDMLQGGVEGRRVLDLFSGTGAVGFEALSSDAGEVVFVEINKAQAKRISADLRQLGFEKNTRVICLDALKAIQNLAESEEKFNIVFLDPPYEKGLGIEALEFLAASPLLLDHAVVIFECRNKESLPRFDGLREIKTKDYGDTKIILFQKEKI